MSPTLQLTVLVFCFGCVFAAKQPCCYSSKFTGRMAIDTTSLASGSKVPHYSQNRFQLDFDGNKKMILVRGNIYQNVGNKETDDPYNVLIDYNNGTQYIYNNVSGLLFCKTEPVDPKSFQTSCVPSTLTLGETYIYGSGSESLRVDSWEGIGPDGFRWSFQTSVDGCVPVSHTRFGMDQNGTRIIEVTLYADMEANKFSTPDPFMIPDHCNM